MAGRVARRRGSQRERRLSRGHRHRGDPHPAERTGGLPRGRARRRKDGASWVPLQVNRARRIELLITPYTSVRIESVDFGGEERDEPAHT